MNYYFDPAKDKAVPPRKDGNRNSTYVDKRKMNDFVQIYNLYSMLKNFSDFHMDNNNPNFALAHVVKTMKDMFNQDFMKVLKENRNSLVEQLNQACSETTVSSINQVLRMLIYIIEGL